MGNQSLLTPFILVGVVVFMLYPKLNTEWPQKYDLHKISNSFFEFFKSLGQIKLLQDKFQKTQMQVLFATLQNGPVRYIYYSKFFSVFFIKHNGVKIFQKCWTGNLEQGVARTLSHFIKFYSFQESCWIIYGKFFCEKAKELL